MLVNHVKEVERLRPLSAHLKTPGQNFGGLFGGLFGECLNPIGH